MEVILFFAVLAGLVWGAALIARGGLLAGCCLVLLAGSCFGHPFFHTQLGPLPITADRLLLAVLVVAYAAFRKLGLADPKPLRKSDYVLFALVGLLVVSTFTHAWWAGHSQPVARLLLEYLMPVALYWVARQTKLTATGVYWVFGLLAAFAVYLGVTAIAESHDLWWAVFPKYVVNSGYKEFLGRGRGPFLNPISCGVFISLGMFAAVLAWPQLSRGKQLGLLVLLMPLYTAGVYYSLTRSVWMGAGLGLLLLGWFIAPRNWRAPAIGGASLLALAFVAANWDSLTSFKRDKNVSEHDMAESAELRPILAVVAWKMFLDCPLLGCGYAQYDREKFKYLADRSSGMTLEKARRYTQHNAFLAFLSQTGIMGLALYVTLLALWGLDAWRLWNAGAAPLWARRQALLFLALLAVYVTNGMFHDICVAPMVNMIVFFMAGVTTGLTQLAAPPRPPLAAGARQAESPEAMLLPS